MAAYEGVWRDHASGTLLLTLSPKAAGFLSAAIVTWITILARATWPVFRMLLWMAIENAGSDISVYDLQQSVVLRNGQSAIGLASSISRMGIEWKIKRRGSLVRTAVLVLAGLLIFIMWTVAGLFAPYIYTHSAPQVLVARSDYCGNLVPPNITASNSDAVTDFRLAQTSLVNQAETYVQQCYGNNMSSACTSFARQSLPFTAQDALDCPAANASLCYTQNSTTLQLDTGLLDSNNDLGINTAEGDAAGYRRVVTCSPVHSTPFISVANVTSDNPLNGTPQYDFLMGPNGGRDFTFRYQDYQQYFTIPYTVDLALYYPQNPYENDWQPDAMLYNSNNADFSILAVEANAIQYLEPTYDPIFLANLPFTVDYGDGTSFTAYSSTHLVNLLACKEQHQLCLPTNSNHCTSLTGLYALGTEAAKLVSSKTQSAVVARIIASLEQTYLFSSIFWKGSGILLASRSLNDYVQTRSLPVDQWKTEVANMFSIALARLQADIVAYATGPNEPVLHPFVDRPASGTEADKMCTNQRVANRYGKVNFDMVPLIVVFVLGAVLIFIGLAFEKLVERRSRAKPPVRRFWDHWRREGLLYLHREALEATQGVGRWYDLDKEVPKSRQTVARRSASPQEPAVMLLHRTKQAENFDN